MASLTSPSDPSTAACGAVHSIEPGQLDARAVGVMSLLCLIWSLQQISLKAAADQASPMLMVALRSGLALTLLLALMCKRREKPTSARWKAGAAVGVLFGVEYLLVTEALRLTSAAHVVVLLYTAPIFAAIALHVRLPAERLRPLQMAGVLLAFAGIASAFLARASSPADSTDTFRGDALALLGALAWAATTVTIRGSRLATAPATETLMYQLIGAFVLLLPAAWLTGNWRFEPTLEVWLHLSFQTLVMSFASLLAWCWLLRTYLASRLGVFSFLTPLFGVILGVALLGETLERSFLVGSVLVLGGLALVSGHEVLSRYLSGRCANTPAARASQSSA